MTDSGTLTIRHLQQENYRLKSDNTSLREYVARLQRAINAMVTLQKSLEGIGPKTDVFQLVHKILATALDAINSENGSLSLLDQESGDLVFVEVIGSARDKLINFRLPKGQGIAHWTIDNLTSKLVEDIRKEPDFFPKVDQLTGFNTNSLICVPLVHSGRPIGAIEVVNTRTGRPFNQGDREVMELVSQLAALAIASAEKSQIGE